MEKLKTKIRDIQDFPKPGIVFKDITPLLKDPSSLHLAIEQLAKPYLKEDITAVAGIEARGFIFGSLVASLLGIGFIPLRKPNKLPCRVVSVDYTLEYGTTSLEIHHDAIKPGDRILLIDDLLATGGTAMASCQLVEKLGGKVIACVFLIELTQLTGRERLSLYPIHTLLAY
jgi:adenine phosphoribosyltransferase